MDVNKFVPDGQDLWGEDVMFGTMADLDSIIFHPNCPMLQGPVYSRMTWYRKVLYNGYSLFAIINWMSHN